MNVREILSEKIAGEIILSIKPGKTIRKWRNSFGISQIELANHLKLSPSVISDYESGRRKSPGIHNIKRIIEAFLDIDEKKGGKKIRNYESIIDKSEGVIEIKEYPFTITADTLIKKIDGNTLTSNKTIENKKVNGFTIVDSIKAIETINPVDYIRLYGWNPERALIFTGIKYGRSPMVAVRVHPVKPAIVIYHKPAAVDHLAVKLAERENIPLATTNLTLDELKNRLISLGK